MEFKERVIELLNEYLSENTNVFLVDLTITDAYKIIVTLDGDNGLTLQDCIDVSRKIEHNLDREEFDFSLEVASAGVSSPLKLKRQYVKNIGRTLRVETATGIIEGTLTEANDDCVTLTWEARETKKVGKGKETVRKEQRVNYKDIKEAIVIITFK